MAKIGSASAMVDMFPKDLLLSIKPEYASAIMEGRKTVELRRKFPDDVAGGSRAYLYSSSPVQAVVGLLTIERVDRMPLALLWRKHGPASCIDRATFDAYFDGQADGCAVVLRSAKALSCPIPRDLLMTALGLVPPQSFMYLPSEFEKTFVDGAS